jgi:hypothetical protein
MLRTVDPRHTFRQAADFFVHNVGMVGPTQWNPPGLGEWSVRDLVGHTSRALLTVETYLERPAGEEAAASALDYFITVLAAYGDPREVAQRGREAGVALGSDPDEAVREIAGRVVARVERPTWIN